MSSRQARRWLATRDDAGATPFRIGRAGERLVAEWPGLCVLEAAPDGATFELHVVAGADPRAVEKIRTGAARGLVARLAGKLALHAGAVSRDGASLVIIGRHAAGKSTTTASLTRRGASLLADDIALLDEIDGRIVVDPTERDHWLLPDARHAIGLADAEIGKVPIPAAHLAVAAAPLVAVVSLEFVEGPTRMTPISGLDVMADVVPSLVRFIIDDDDFQRREFDQLVGFASRVPFYRLHRARDLRRLDEAASLLEGLLVAGRNSIV